MNITDTLDFLFKKQEPIQLEPKPHIAKSCDVFDLDGHRWVIETRQDIFRIKFLKELKEMTKGESRGK